MSRLFVLEMFVCSYRLSLSLSSSSSSSSILLLPLLMPGEKLHPSGLLFFANVLLSFFIVFLRRSPSFRLDRNCLHSFFDRLWLSDRLWFLFHINRQNSVLHRRFDLLWIRAFWESKNSLDSPRGPFDGMPFHAPILRLILLLVLRSFMRRNVQVVILIHLDVHVVHVTPRKFSR